MRKFLAVLKARTMEFVRDRGTFFWNLLFPILMVAGFSFAFTGDGTTLFKVGLIGDRAAFESSATAAQTRLEGDAIDPRAMRSFLAIPELKLIPYGEPITSAANDAPVGGGAAIAPEKSRAAGLATALDRLQKHQLDMVVDLTAGNYYLNDRSPASDTLARLLSGEVARVKDADTNDAKENTRAKPSAEVGTATNKAASDTIANHGFTAKTVSGDSIRYVDWLVPGVIGMNMMFSCLFGVGFVLVRYRKNGVLKRLKATPVGALNFLTAQAVSRFLIAFATSIVVFAGTNAFLHFKMEGSYLLLTAILALGILSMIALGLLFATRFKSEELASGVINLFTFPMMLFSGVFFSLEGSPAALRNAAKAFPLTHFLDASRAVMLDGAGLAAVWPEMAILAGMSVAFIALSTALFKWE
jgi:ABC-type multidrug transport system permease subunit